MTAEQLKGGRLEADGKRIRGRFGKRYIDDVADDLRCMVERLKMEMCERMEWREITEQAKTCLLYTSRCV